MLELITRYYSEFLDETLKYDWDIRPADRSFDQTHVREYLSFIPPPYHSVIKQFIDNTTYVSYPEFKDALFRSFKMFAKSICNTPIFLYVDVASELWNTALLWPQLKDLNISGMVTLNSFELGILDINSRNNILIIKGISYWWYG